jgi:hypothetical protein
VVEESPFLIWGRPVDDPAPPALDDAVIAEIQEVTRLFPDIQSCLDDSGNSYAEQDSENLLFGPIYRDTNSRVCLYRIFASLKEPAAIERWMISLGWASWGIGEVEMSHYAGKPPIVTMMFQREMITTALDTPPDSEQLREAQFVSVEVDADGIIQNVLIY